MIDTWRLIGVFQIDGDCILYQHLINGYGECRGKPDNL